MIGRAMRRRMTGWNGPRTFAMSDRQSKCERMKKLELDGGGWDSKIDFYEALAAALGSFAEHGRNPDAFLETMIYLPELNKVQPPYEVVIRYAPDDLRPYLTQFASWIAEARQDRRSDPDWGDDVEVIVSVA